MITKEDIREIKLCIALKRNAINTIKNTNANYIKDGLRSGCNILFFDNCNDFKFGIDSHYSFQIQNNGYYTKKWVLETLQDDLEKLQGLLM